MLKSHERDVEPRQHHWLVKGIAFYG